MALRDPWIAICASFMLGLLIGAGVLLVTNSKRWHDRRHTARGVAVPIGCDRCLREWYARWDRQP